MMITAEQAFRKIYSDVAEGALVKPRGELVKELEDYSYVLPPYARFANFNARNLKLDYVRKELLWYLRANPFDNSIVDAASLWQELPNRDSSINSNYGAHVFGKLYKTAESVVPVMRFSSDWRDDFHNDQSIAIGEPLSDLSQLEYIVQTLVNDRDSRRASAVILNRKHLLSPATKDYPCTYALNFRIRDNELKMSVHMRSQDGVFGLGNDAPAFSLIQEIVYVLVRDAAYPDLKMGSYHHIADSFHIYERHFAMVDAINRANPFTEIDVPRIKNAREVAWLLTGMHPTYQGGERAVSYWATRVNTAAHQTLSAQLGFKADYYAAGDFTNWLLQGQT